jgi:outer membrane protein OmpA-like peptidoglycan-associated protein
MSERGNSSKRAAGRSRLICARASGARRSVAGTLSAVALALLLAGCSTVDDTWNDFFGDDPAPQRVSTAGAAAQQDSPPNLSVVPEKAPTASSAVQRQALQRSLREDRQAAEYSDQPLKPGSAPTAPPRMTPEARPEMPSAPALQQPTYNPPATPPQSAYVQPTVSPRAAGTHQPQAVPSGQPIAVIYFRHGSAALDARDRQIVAQAAALQRQNGGQLRVIGHSSQRTATTDAVKHSIKNFEMSLKRAQAVAGVLRANGVADAGLLVEARGSGQPVFYEFMPTGEAGNRRVEIFLER